MTLPAALAILLASASSGLLDEARGAFAAADYPRAERLALEAAAVEPAPALYLAGLARFRTGRPAEALLLLDGAEAGADSAAAWHYNRGACLYELGRHGEAEAEFLEAAGAPAFAAAALVNAAFAALDGGDPARARALAARARREATGAAVTLVEELEQALQEGAATPDRSPAAGDPASAPAAVAPPPAWPPGSPPGRAWALHASAEAGRDSDATRAGAGALERPGSRSGVASAFAAAAVGLDGQAPLLGATGVASYRLAQLAYLARGAQDQSLQQHDLTLALRAAPLPPLQVELALLGQYALAGLSGLRGLQASAGVRLAASLDEGELQTTRAEVSFTAKDGRGAEFASLDGDRLEAAASHEVRLEPLLLRAGYRFQLERIGTVSTRRPLDLMEVALCGPGCTAADLEPLAYAGHTGWLGASLDAWPGLRLDLGGGLEWRQALHDLRSVLTPPIGAPLETRRRHRTDLRWFTGEAAALRLAPWLTLTLRHEWLATRTRLEAVGGAFGDPMGRGPDAPAWSKHVFTAGASLEW